MQHLNSQEVAPSIPTFHHHLVPQNLPQTINFGLHGHALAHSQQGLTNAASKVLLNFQPPWLH